MRYLLVDRILEYQPDLTIRGTKNIAMAEDYFANHFPGFPVMPGALILEAMAQLANILVAISTNFSKTAIVNCVQSAKFKDFARPGDVLSLEVRFSELSPTLVSCKGRASIDNKMQALADFDMVLEKLEGAHEKEEIKRLVQVLERSIDPKNDFS